MNRIKTMLALTGAVGLLATLPASQASAHHVPGATYTGTHEQGGPVSFTLSGEGQGCVGAQRKVKKLKKKLKKADGAQQKKKLRKKLRRAKKDMTLVCNEIRIPPGTTPTGSLVNRISIGGPVTGVSAFDLPCPVLGPTETAVYGFEGIYRSEIFSQDGLHVVLIRRQNSPVFVDIDTGGSYFLEPRTAFGSFDLTGDLPPSPTAKCRVDNLRFTATP